MNYEVISVNKSSSLTLGEDKDVADEPNDNSLRFLKDGFHNYVNKEITIQIK